MKCDEENAEKFQCLLVSSRVENPKKAAARLLNRQITKMASKFFVVKPHNFHLN